ncbi:MAG: hypothetical protein QF632_03535 [Candidatus Woesearchaeota archaeon]|jgi:lauroyl/myristoyl acyltransferase|nr:hypothetical protein [Candidatus Woesearchaeota archaeon]MDP7457906.1 hypothetical protein [Candidatus Woesearchaeota archaeon]
MPKKGQTKDKITISIDKELHDELKKDCEKSMAKLSTYIEHLIRRGKNAK